MVQIAVTRGRLRDRPRLEDRMRSWTSSSSGRLLIVAAVLGTLGGGCNAGAPGTPVATPTASATAPATPATPVSRAASATPSTGPTPSPSVAQLQVLSATDAGADSKILEAGFGAVWAASSDGLLKVSATGMPDVVLSGQVIDIGLGPKTVFALVAGDRNGLVEVDPTTGKTLRHWALAPSATSLVVTAGAVYVDHATYPATIDRIDLKTGVLRPIVVSAAPDGLVGGQALAAGDGLVWAAAAATVFGLDPTNLSVRKTGHLSSAVDDLWFGDGSVWASSKGYGAGVHRIAATGSEVARVASDAIQIAFSPHGVWLSAAAGPTEIDPTTAAVLATLPDSNVLGSDAAGIAVVDGEVWVDYKDSGQLQRIKVP